MVRSIDEGGQAHVYLVEDSSGKHPGSHILKRLKNRGRLDLFEREVKAIMSVNHPHVLHIVESDLTADTPYYVAEYCEAGILARKVGQFRGDIKRTISVLVPIADALEAAHAIEVMHRDVKPSNILFRLIGTPVLGDFGICHMEGDERITLTDEAMGSRNYIAPEMESGRLGPPTDRTDVYSLGKVAYWMLSGGREFARENHRAENLYLPHLLGDQRWDREAQVQARRGSGGIGSCGS